MAARYDHKTPIPTSLQVGRLGHAHGVAGEVVVNIETSSPEERFGRPGNLCGSCSLVACGCDFCSLARSLSLSLSLSL